jgi:hypothetical protein
MMSISGKTMQRTSTLLLSVFLLSSGLRTAHAVFSHGHAHEQVVCDAPYNGQDQHLHDDRYEPDHCQLCTFFCFTPVLPEPVALVLFVCQSHFSPVFSVEHGYVDGELLSNPGRAPPVA